MNRDQLITKIESSFNGVTLINGIGIFEAEAIDNYETTEVRKIEREKDIRDHWQSIPDDVIGQYYSVLSFMDDNGLKFALPAYMRFATKYYDTSASASIDSVIYTLANQRNWEFLSNEQKETIADFLSFMVLEADSHVDSRQASLAYENIWSQYQQNKT